MMNEEQKKTEKDMKTVNHGRNLYRNIKISVKSLDAIIIGGIVLLTVLTIWFSAIS